MQKISLIGKDKPSPSGGGFLLPCCVAGRIGVMANDVVYSNVRELTRRLKAIDPELRKALVRDAKKVAKPVATEIANNIPVAAPLSGMEKPGRLNWEQSSNRKGQRIRTKTVRTKFSASGSKKTAVTSLVKVQVMSPAVSMVDMARRGRTRAGIAMVNNLAGRASRFVWPAAEKKLPEAKIEVQKILEVASAKITRSF